MSKSNGALFSKTLFGYKRTNVNEYIRHADEEHADEISKLKVEILKLENHVGEAESRIKELELVLENERASALSKIKELESKLESERVSSALKIQELMDDSNKKLSEVEKCHAEISNKLSESEARATSYLKLADASSLRAESAESEVALLSAGLESARVELEELKKNKVADTKKIAELEELVENYTSREELNKAERRKYFVIKRPSLMRFIHRK